MTTDSRLVMSQGPQPGQTFMIDRDVVTIGRDPANDIVINDPQASRQHAHIKRQGNLMIIEDLGSTNGTFANGVRLTNPHTLSNGDVIGLGDSVRLTYHGASPDASMTAPTEVLVGEPTAPLQASYTPPPPPTPSPSPQPAPPPAYAAPPPPPASAPPPPYAPAPPIEEKKSRTGLWLGCGCLVLLVIFVCVGMFVLDYFEMLPPVFYQPLYWLGLDKFLVQ
ncbi:MAG: hypothetical protein DRJ03_22255 [Chloroflexi bacterium]|nr:MAG: hypothetical protein DRI81_11835 [Chloroflexota bacterium]RLC80131.1 MAG: hypothetical protein DRJ03_22255 [Chloroflexota bacterium]HEY72100.1 FHA domain-containing protein [Thermoflexia bacterium]